LGEDRFIEGLESRRRAYDAALQELLLLRRQTRQDVPDAKELRRVWPELDVMEKRALLRTVFDAVVVRKPQGEGTRGAGRRVQPVSGPGASVLDRMHFLLAGEMDATEWPRRNVTMPIRPFVFPDH
jgi:hypothetical protein